MPSCHPTNSVKALKATSTLGLGRRRLSFPQWCYLHHLHTIYLYLVSTNRIYIFHVITLEAVLYEICYLSIHSVFAQLYLYRCIWLPWGYAWYYKILQSKDIWTYWKANTIVHPIFHSWWVNVLLCGTCNWWYSMFLYKIVLIVIATLC